VRRIFDPLLQYVEDLNQISSMLLPGWTSNQKCHENKAQVIIRMDDVQDNWLDEEQISIMDLFISRNQHLSLGLIMNNFGMDSKIVNTVSAGYDTKLFELGIHGWNHTDYTKLTEVEQMHSLCNSNKKMLTLFGTRSNLFIAPFGLFNSNTIRALKKLNIQILSANLSSELIFDRKKSVFSVNNKISNKTASIYHMPMTVPFKIQVGGIKFRIPLDKIMRKIENDIARYGYAVIVVHPQDLLGNNRKSNNKNWLSTTNSKNIDLEMLSLLVDELIANRIETTSFAAVTGI